MNKVYFCLLLIIVSGCKKEKDLPPAEEQFLNKVTVKGAREVKWDDEAGVVQIVLPESYKDDLVKLDLTLYPGASLVLNPNDNFTPTQAQFYYKASDPGYFNIQRNDTGFTKGYKVYVEHEGKLEASLVSDFLIYPSRGDTFDIVTSLKITSGVGTIPKSPGRRQDLTGTLADPAQNFRISATGYYPLATFVMPSTKDIPDASNLTFTLSYGEKALQFPSPVKISRAPANAYVTTYSISAPLTRNKLITINGGFFLEKESYRISLTNDAQPAPFWIDAKYKDHSRLTFTIPSQLPNGSYLVNYYEGTNLLSNQNATVTDNDTAKAIGLVWTQQAECPSVKIFPQIPKKTKIQAGADLYATASPFIMQTQQTPYNPNKSLPELELKNAEHTYLIKPKVNVDICYGDGTLAVYYGGYTIPANAVRGKYAARFIFAENEQSLPYWNFIEVY